MHEAGVIPTQESAEPNQKQCRHLLEKPMKFPIPIIPVRKVSAFEMHTYRAAAFESFFHW
jgi:hypothetical protein